MKRSNVQIPEDLHRRLKIRAAKQGQAIKVLVVDALRAWLEVLEEQDQEPA